MKSNLYFNWKSKEYIYIIYTYKLTSNIIQIRHIIKCFSYYFAQLFYNKFIGIYLYTEKFNHFLRKLKYFRFTKTFHSGLPIIGIRYVCIFQTLFFSINLLYHILNLIRLYLKYQFMCFCIAYHCININLNNSHRIKMLKCISTFHIVQSYICQCKVFEITLKFALKNK